MPPVDWNMVYTSALGDFEVGNFPASPLGYYEVRDTRVVAPATYKRVGRHYSEVDGETIQTIAESLEGATFHADSLQASV